VVLLTLREAALACDTSRSGQVRDCQGQRTLIRSHSFFSSPFFNIIANSPPTSSKHSPRQSKYQQPTPEEFWSGIRLYLKVLSPLSVNIRIFTVPLEHHSTTSPNRKFSISTLPPLPEVLHTSAISCSQEASIQREQSCLHVRSCQGSFSSLDTSHQLVDQW
jgi:hypothetical protein